MDIEIKTYKFNGTGDVLKASSGSYRQEFTIDSRTASSVTGAHGMIVSIPAGALETKDGKPVNSTHVKVVLEEYASPGDFIFKQLSTVCEGKMIETGGMFNITASLDGEELQLSEGKVMAVEMPSSNIQKDMELFTSVVNPQGVTEWKATSQPFRAEPRIRKESPYIELENIAYIESLITAVDEVKTYKAFRYKLPVAPTRLSRPRKPKPVNPRSEDELFTATEKILLSRAVRDRRIEKERLRCVDENSIKIDRYNKRLESYRLGLIQYSKDSSKYRNEDLQAFRSWLTMQKASAQQSIEQTQRLCFNRALRRVVNLSKNKKLKSADPSQLLETWALPRGSQLKIINYYNNAITQLNYLLDSTSFSKANEYVRESSGNVLDIFKRSSKKGVNYRYYSHWPAKSFVDSMFGEHKILAMSFANAKTDILKKREELGLVNAEQVDMVYRTSIGRFGSFNCDRFSNTPPDQMVSVRVELKGAATGNISFYIPSLKGNIYAYNMLTHFEVRLPKNTPMTMVAIALQAESPTMLVENKVFTENTMIQTIPEEVTLEEIKHALSKIK